MRLIRKNSGEFEPFNVEKFQISLTKAGATAEVIEKLSKDVLTRTDINSTHDLYTYAYNYLKQELTRSASRYSIKNALYELGPDGFAFEQFMAELFRSQQYHTVTDQIVNGTCVAHELDIVLERDETRIMVECKFHNTPGLQSDVKIPLYIKARFDDIKNANPDRIFHKALLITNTKFTEQAIIYGKCAGLVLIGWNYPQGGSIVDLIDQTAVRPITSIATLTKHQKSRLIQQGIYSCNTLLENQKLLHEFGLDKTQIQSILNECAIEYKDF